MKNASRSSFVKTTDGQEVVLFSWRIKSGFEESCRALRSLGEVVWNVLYEARTFYEKDS